MKTPGKVNALLPLLYLSDVVTHIFYLFVQLPIFGPSGFASILIPGQLSIGVLVPIMCFDGYKILHIFVPYICLTLRYLDVPKIPILHSSSSFH